MTKRTPTFTRLWYAILPLAILCAPLTAHAQPADDPGLSEPPPPPPPVTAPPSTTSTMPPAPSNNNTMAPPSSEAGPGEVKETRETKITYEKNRDDQRDLYDRLAAPTVTGPIGLFHTMTGDVGLAGTLRVGINLQLFEQSAFLIAGNATTMGDSNSRFLGNLTIGYTPWKYLEVYLALFNSSNQNTRTDPGRTDPEVILGLGDVGAGVKGRVPLARWFDLGLNLGVKFFNSVSAVSVNGPATNFTADLIGSFDLRHATLPKKVPLRFHINFGYLYDGSINLLPDGQCATSTSNDVCIRSRVVETFGYGIGASRFRLAAAVDAPFQFGSVGLEGFAEYHAEIAVGDGDQTVLRALMNDASVVAADRLTGNSLQYMTFGVRVRPIVGLILDAGVDIGLSSPGFQYGPPVPTWNLVLGAAYAFDVLGAARSKVVTNNITREVSHASVEGKLRGMVRDSVTRKAVSGALIKYNRRATPQVTGDDGSFLSYGFAEGPIAIDVTRDDYEPAHVESMIPPNGETPIEVMLVAKPPQNGVIHVKVSDAEGLPVATATVRFTGAATGAVVDGEGDGPGGFVAKLPPGDYHVEIAANGYLSKQRQVTVAGGQPQSLDVLLRKKPTTSHVSLGKGEIVIKGTIHFGTNNAEIRPDGEQLLDEVADVMVKHPELRKIRVEGHTDNRGAVDKNLELSKARAAAVVAYLVKQGIDAARLESEGYGASQPLVPNITPANRAKNRRVAFKILDGSNAP